MKLFISLVLIFFDIISICAQPEANLKLNLKTGETYFVENNIKSVTEQDLMGETQVITKDEASSFLFSVINKTNHNSYYIQITYKHFKTELDVQNNVEAIDTDSIDETSVLSRFYSSLINKSFYIEINTRGEILKIDSLNSLIKHNIIDELDVFTKITLKKQFEEETIRSMALFTQFPEKVIQEKESWYSSDTAVINIFNIINTKYSLEKITKDTYIIKKTSSIFTDKNKNLNVNNIFINYNMKGSSFSSKVFDKNSCMIKESSSTQHVSGTAGMKYSEDSENALSWPIKITNTISVKAYKIEK